MKIVALIPAYDEELPIATVIEQARTYASSVIVVIDGSGDNIHKLAK